MQKLKDILLVLSIILLGPIGLLFVCLWKREWLKNYVVLGVVCGWSIFYTIAAFSSSREPTESAPSSIAVSQTNGASKNSSNMDLTEEGVEVQEAADIEKTEQAIPPETNEYNSTNTNGPEEQPPVSQPQESHMSGFPNITYDDPTGECIIKGNVNSKGEKIYHTPASKSYKRTKINPEEGDQLFCTEQEARDAGFRSALD